MSILWPFPTRSIPSPFVALDAILSWDPAHLELLGVDNSGAGYSWLYSTFPSNGDLTRGWSEAFPPTTAMRCTRRLRSWVCPPSLRVPPARGLW